MAGFGEALDQVLELVLDAAVMPELMIEFRQIALAWQVALQQQPGGFFETTLAGQRFHGDAAIFQTSIVTVDKADGRLCYRYVLQARTQFRRTHEDFPGHRRWCAAMVEAGSDIR